MKNIAIVFAGGTGQRMTTKSKPKQFLELHGKPILVYTLEAFNNHPLIDGIILVILAGWEEYCKRLKTRYQINKLEAVVTGGITAQESILIGLRKASVLYGPDTLVLIHDGVRPLIDEDTISRDIESVNNMGNAITVSPAIETVTIKGSNGEIGKIIERSLCEMARAPQCFMLKDILGAHEKAFNEGREYIDSASLMQAYGFKLFSVIGPSENIKITTPSDFYIFKAIVDARENSQILGV